MCNKCGFDFEEFANKFDFFIRNQIRFSRKYSGKNEPKEGLFLNLPPEKTKIIQEKEEYYLKKYNLEKLKNNSTKLTYLENLSVLELLEENLHENNTDKELKILDIGSKNWSYAFAEYSFFKFLAGQNNISLTGIELDAYKRYMNLHSRYDYAMYHTKNLSNTRYIAEDFLEHTEKYDYIVWFLPFVTRYPLIKWGIPMEYFKPTEMLKHACNLLNPDGKMIITNQNEEEYSIQKRLLTELGISFKEKGEFKSIFPGYQKPRFVTVVENNNGKPA